MADLYIQKKKKGSKFMHEGGEAKETDFKKPPI